MGLREVQEGTARSKAKALARFEHCMRSSDKEEVDLFRAMDQLIPFKDIVEEFVTDSFGQDRWAVLHIWFRVCEEAGLITGGEHSALTYWSAWC